MKDKELVYIHKNKINNKIYVGITSQKSWARWGILGQRYCLKDTKFSRAIKKYGFDGFDHIIIKENLSHKEAAELEKNLIEKYDSYKHGYNMTLGGDGGGFLGHHHTIESIKKSTKVEKENGMYGKTRPDYVKDAVRKAHSKTIYQYDINYNLINVYPSGYELMRQTGYDNSYISRKCRSKNNLAYGYHWSYKNLTTYND